MANLLVTLTTDIEHGVEIAAEDVLKFVGIASATTAQAGPGALAAFGVLMAAVDKAVGDIAAGAAAPATLVLSLPQDINDIKAVWPAIVAQLATFGVKI